MSRVTFTLRADLELLDQWRAMAGFAGMSLNEFLTLWLSTSVEGGQWLSETINEAKHAPGKLVGRAQDIVQEHGLDALNLIVAAANRASTPPLTNRGGTSNQNRGGHRP